MKWEISENVEYRISVLTAKDDVTKTRIKFPLINGKNMIEFRNHLGGVSSFSDLWRWRERVKAIDWIAPEIKPRDEWKREF